ncbi:MAG: hypothetical protein JST31_09800 [Actinobacteria bacterium]|nr:hypothetical protein [Actinomycetota bacterium]
MPNGSRRIVGTRGGLGRIVAMALALAVGLLLVLAGAARGEVLTPIGLTAEGGNGWHQLNDFAVSWTNPPGYAIAGANWRIAGPSYSGASQFIAGFGISRIEGIRVPAAGSWELTVWLRDQLRYESPMLAASLELRFDDVPPAVDFVPGGTAPPQLVAAVSDPVSGVASGEISYRRLDEESWTALPTELRAGAFGAELAAATPPLRPGAPYLFRAEAGDVAGNLGSTTTGADGTPMVLAAPPSAGAPGTAARAAHLRAVLVGRHGGRGASELTAAAGEAVVLRGRLTVRAPGADGGVGAALAGRRLRVASRPVRGARAADAAEVVETDADGRFELPLPAGPSRRVTVASAGGKGLAPLRRRLALRVRAAVSLRAVPRRLRTGGLVLLEGRVGSRDARIPRSGKLVTISYRERETGRWRPVIVTRSDRRGRFHAGYRFRYVTGRALIRLRATAPAEAGWPYAPGFSPPVTLEVRG